MGNYKGSILGLFGFRVLGFVAFVRVGMISGPSRSGAVGAWELRTKLREPLSPLKGPYSPLKGAL